MKRLLLVVLLCLCAPAVWAAHFNCTLDSTCTAAAPCDWATAGNWNDNGLCNADYPHNGANTFTANIPANTVVRLATSGLTIGLVSQTQPAIHLAGTMMMTEPQTGNNYQTLTVIPSNGSGVDGAFVSVGITTTGKLYIGPSNRLFTDTSGGGGTISKLEMAGGSILSVEGKTARGTVQQVYGPIHNDTLCGTPGGTTELQYYIMTLDAGVELAKLQRRIHFEDGELRNRAYEIVAVDSDVNDLVAATCTGAGAPVIPGLPAAQCTGAGTANPIIASPTSGTAASRGAIGFCTWLADGTSGTTGQRLTGHIATGQFPDATPSASTRHWTPAPEGNDICTAAKAPEPFCTGVQAGTGYRIYPKPGDKVTVVDDATLGMSAGTNVFSISGVVLTTLPRFRAFHVVGGRLSFQSSGNPSTDSVSDYEYGNIHDSQQGGNTVTLSGWQNQTIRKTIHHDFSTGAGIGGGSWHQLWSANNTGPTPDNCAVEDSVYYRLSGGMVVFQSSGTTLAGSGYKIRRNIFYNGCTRDGECNGVELDFGRFSEVTDNLCYDIAPLGSPPSSSDTGNCFRMTNDASVTGAGEGTVFARNIGVNAFNDCIKVQGGPNPNGQENVAATANYCSNIARSGIRVGRAYGNVIRNWGIDKAAIYFGLDIPITAYGNFLLGQDDAVESGYCAAACSSYGIKGGGTSNSLTAPNNFSDNVIKVGSMTTAMFGVAVGASGTGANNIDHNTIDTGGKACSAGISFASWTPTASTDANIRDNACTHMNDSRCGECPTVLDADAHVIWGTYTGNRSPTAAERISDLGPISNTGNCNGSTGTRVNTGTVGLGFRDRVRLDYGYVERAPALTLGQFPAGSALGSRAFRFNWSRFLWKFPFNLSAGDPTGETTTALPADFSNGTCEGLTECNQDTDGDGVGDLWDNCDRTFNPSQWDDDGDGIGCACDTDGDTCS